MTLAEFKASFEGYTEGIGAAPNEAQWERIRTVVGRLCASTAPANPYAGYQTMNPGTSLSNFGVVGSNIKKPA